MRVCVCVSKQESIWKYFLQAVRGAVLSPGCSQSAVRKTLAATRDQIRFVHQRNNKAHCIMYASLLTPLYPYTRTHAHTHTQIHIHIHIHTYTYTRAHAPTHTQYPQSTPEEHIIHSEQTGTQCMASQPEVNKND